MYRRFRAFLHATRGICHTIATEPHAKIHVTIAVAVVCIGWYFDAQRDDWCWFVACIGIVLTAESFNAAIERLADRISLEHHHLLRDAKDAAAGAVLLAAIASAFIGVIRFYPLIAKAIGYGI